MPTPQEVSEPSGSAEDLTGRTVGRFNIRARLGRGGMGEVYRAEDTKLKRPIALKRLASHLRADPRFRQRLLKEAERASALNCHNIASVYDVLEEAGEVYLVMEYVEGSNLRQRLRAPLALGEFVEIATQCAEALVAAHAKGIIHRDLKPENIMLTPTGQVKVLDFGLAKHLPVFDEGAITASFESRPVGPAGTPGYIAPEALLDQEVDERADIFSLGVVLYEALSGSHPFRATGFAATSDRVLHEAPAPLSKTNPAVPAEVERIVAKMLAKDRTQRYATAADLLVDLRAVRRHLEQGTAPPRAARESASGSRTRRFLIAGLLLALAAAIPLVLLRAPARPPAFAERGWVLIADFDNSAGEALFDKTLSEGLSIALQQSRYINVYPKERTFDALRRMKRSELARIDESLGREICQRENLQVLLVGSIQRSGDAYRLSVRGLEPATGNLLFAESERFDRKEQLFERVDDLARRVRQDLGESLGGIGNSSRPLAKVTTRSLEALQQYSLATDAMARGDTEKVQSLLEGALALDPDFASAHMLLGSYYGEVVGKNERALTELAKAYELRQGTTDGEQRRIEASYYAAQERYEEEADALKVLASLHPDDAGAHQSLAMAYYDLGDLPRSIAELRQVIRLNPFSVRAYSNLVLFLARASSPEEAIRAYREAAQRGIQSPYFYWGLGLAFLSQGKTSEARKQFGRLAEEEGAYRSLGQLYLARTSIYEGRLGAAVEELQAGMQLDQKLSGQGLQLTRHYLMGRIFLLRGERSAARRQAAAILTFPETQLQVNDLRQAGTLYAQAGDIPVARNILRRLDVLRARTPTSFNVTSFHNLAGEIALAEGRPQAAVESFRSAASQSPRFLSHLGLARAYQAQQDWGRALTEWQQVLGAPGEVLQDDFPADWVLAQLEVARLSLRANDLQAARRNYHGFVRTWGKGDDLPVRRQARAEFQHIDELPGPRPD